MSIGELDQAGDSKITSMDILVVDDDELSRRMMQVILSREGHRVDVAVNGLEGFNAVKSKKYDMVLMDLQMPVMDGLEASQRIREWEKEGARTFIVALTASYLPERGQNMFDAGMDNYISKPFELEHLQRMLKYRSDAILAQARSAATVPNEEVPVRDVVDFRKGVKRVGGDIQTYWELFGDFIQELPTKTAALQQYFALGDLEGLSRAAHNLKGVAANLGVLQLSAYADRLDKQSSEGYTQLIGESLNDIKEVGGKLQDLAQIFLSGREIHAE